MRSLAYTLTSGGNQHAADANTWSRVVMTNYDFSLLEKCLCDSLCDLLSLEMDQGASEGVSSECHGDDLKKSSENVLSRMG